MDQNMQRRRRRKKLRQKRIIRNLILFVFALIIVTGIGFLVRGIKHKQDTPEPPKDSIELQADPVVEEPEPEQTPEEPEEVPDQINTATEEHHKTNGLAICMFHYVYDESNPPENLNNNFIEVHALEAELQYLVENDYYFPSWEEVRKFVDGELLLPEKSVVLTFDDGDSSFLSLGAPLFDKYKIPVTSFLITSADGPNKVATYESKYVTFQSHSDNMHRAGGTIGHGGIFTALSHDDAVTDLKTSIDICKNGDAFAYPYGDYTDDCILAVKDAGFLCAVTTEYGRTNPGANPLALPRVRMLHGQSLQSFIAAVE